MNKIQKHDYNESLDDYLDQNQVFELFEDLMKQLLVAKPDDPLNYLIDKLSEPKGK